MRIVVLATLLLLVACEPKGRKFSWDDVDSSDTQCLSELKKARADQANQKLVYCHYAGNILYQPLRAEHEMDSLLRLHQIAYTNESSPCVIEENRKYHCYCEFMQEQIDTKFGPKFTDSLRCVADKIYISRHLSALYDYTSWDKPPLFPGDSVYDASNHAGLQAAFDRLVVYPAAYQQTPRGMNGLAMANVKLTVDEHGLAKVNDLYFVFNKDDYNKASYPYLSRTITELIESAKWTPAKAKSFKVKSSNNIFIQLK